MRTGPCRAVWLHSTALHCSWWQPTLGGQQPRVGSYKPGLRRWAARGLSTPPQIPLTVLHCSPGEPGAGEGQAGRGAIGSGASHVVQPGATIGLADCLKKEAQVPANTSTCFNFLSQSAGPCLLLRSSPKPGAQKVSKSSLFYKPLPTSFLKKSFRLLFTPPVFFFL